MRSGPILIIEDDRLILLHILKELSITNLVRFFANGQQILDYLLVTNEQPFLILCDVNMPIMNGLELREHIDQNEPLRREAIPFIFLTTISEPQVVTRAYEATIQGFFQKAGGYEAAKEQMRWIVGYWQHCLHPHNGVTRPGPV